jgi:integrase
VDIREFFSWIRTDYVPTRPGGSTKPLAGRSLENIWTATHSFFNFLREEGLVSGKPDHSVRRPVYTPRAIQPFTEEETRTLLKACEYTRPTVSKKRKASLRRSTALRRWARCSPARHGLRVARSRLNVENVDLETGEVEVEPFGTGRKTRAASSIGKGNLVALPGPAGRALPRGPGLPHYRGAQDGPQLDPPDAQQAG